MEKKTVYDIADVYIEDGKIGAFWIYTKLQSHNK